MLTERQRLELYELRSAAVREIEEIETRGRGQQADPYLKRYLQSIDELLKKAGLQNNHQCVHRCTCGGGVQQVLSTI